MAKKKVGLVDLPDAAMDVFNHFTQNADWRVELLVTSTKDSAPKRSARILGITVQDVPSLDHLMQCDLVVVGSDSSPHFATIREMLNGTSVDFALLDEFRARMATGDTASLGEASQAGGGVDLSADIDAALDFALTGTEAPPQETAPAPPAGPAPPLDPGAFGRHTLSADSGFGTPEAPAGEAQGDPATQEPDFDSVLDGLAPREGAPAEPVEHIAFVGTEPKGALRQRGEPEPVEPEIAGSEAVEPEIAGPEAVEPEPLEPEMAESGGSGEASGELEDAAAGLDAGPEPPAFDITPDAEEPEPQDSGEELADPGGRPEAEDGSPAWVASLEGVHSVEEDDVVEMWGEGSTPPGAGEDGPTDDALGPEGPVGGAEPAPLEPGLSGPEGNPEPGRELIGKAFIPDLDRSAATEGSSPGEEEGASFPQEVAEIDLDPAGSPEEDAPGAGTEDGVSGDDPPEIPEEETPTREMERPEIPSRAAAGEPAGTADALGTADAGETTESREAAAGGGFDLGVLLGQDLAAELGPLQIDAANPSLRKLLEGILEATGATTGSLMLPEFGTEHLRIATAIGLSAEIVAGSRPRKGDGLVGKAFALGEPQILQAEIPNLAEAGGSQQYRLAASYPLKRDGACYAVVTVNVESPEPVAGESVVGLLALYASRFQVPVLEAIDLRHAHPGSREKVLTRHIDRIMAMETGFDERLKAAGDVLRAAFSADYVHLYVIDLATRNLELLTEAQGAAAASPRVQPGDRGMLGRMLKSGKSRLVTVPEGDDTELATAYLTVNTNRPYGVLVLEGFSIRNAERASVESLLQTVVGQIEDIFEVERGVETQDILSGIRLRISDQAARLHHLPQELRTRPALDLAVQELNGEVAIWMPGGGQRPVMTQPRNRASATILAEVWDTLDDIGAWIREMGAAACGAEGAGWDSSGPEGPAPYAGVQDHSSDAVLLLFFTPDRSEKPLPRLPLRVLSDVLRAVCEFIRAEAPPEVPAPPPTSSQQDPEVLLTREELEARIREETIRAERTGLPFALTRFRLGAGSEGQESYLGHFLMTHKRTVDVLAELEDGSFVLLSPDTDPGDEGVRQRFAESWARQGSDLDLQIAGFEGDLDAPPMEDAA